MKLLGKIIVLLACFFATPFVARAQFTFFTNNGAITITGGSITNGTLQIPATINGRTVTAIGTNAFQNVAGLTALFLPNSVLDLKDGAFEACNYLSEITLSTSLTNIGRFAFSDCNLTNLNIPAHVISIGFGAFEYSWNLTSVMISSNVSQIGAYAFANCSSLTNIEVDLKNTHFASTNGVLFNQKKTALLVYPAARYGDYAVPAGVTSIAQGAFGDCLNLTSISIPASVTNVVDASLLNIPDRSVPGGLAPEPFGSFSGPVFFASSVNLTNISVDPLNVRYRSFDGTLIDKMNGRLLQCPQGKSGPFIVPTNVFRLGTNCFGSCAQLSLVTMTSSVTNIEAGAFGGCSGLTSMTIPGSVTRIGAEAFAGDFGITNFTLSTNLAVIGESAFEGCQSVPSFFIPRSVTNLAASAFATLSPFARRTPPPFFPGQTAYGLTNITVDVSNTVYSSSGGMLFDKKQTRIIVCPSGKFAGFDLPVTVTNIGDDAFGECYNLLNLTLPPNVVRIGTNAFNNCFQMTNIGLSSGLRTISAGAFGYCYSLTDMVIPTGVKNIPDSVFNGCQALTGITLPNGVTNIGTYTFYRCGLTNIDLPGTLVSIGLGAFSFCPNLVNIIIPASVTSIGDIAFSDCPQLTNFTVTASNPAYASVNGVLFDKKLKQLLQYPAAKMDGNYDVPGTVTNIATSAFESCLNLTNVTLPKSVAGIESFAFSGCANLQTVYFLGNAPVAGPELFPYASFGVYGNLGYFVTNPIVYYLPGTAGWSTSFGGAPMAQWLPEVAGTDPALGIRTNHFGFNITWTSGQKIVVEACTNLAKNVWQPVQTNTLTTNSWYFSDVKWTNFPGRFYRVRSP